MYTVVGKNTVFCTDDVREIVLLLRKYATDAEFSTDRRGPTWSEWF